MIRFSANLGFLWADRPLLARIDAAAAAGFRAIELHWPYDVPAEEVRAACARNGVTLLGLNTAVGNAGEFGLGALAGREASFQAAMDQSIAYCRVTGARSIHAMAGVVAPEDRSASRQTLIRNLAEAAKKAANYGITVLLEPLNPRDKPDYFYSTVAEAADIIAAVGASNVRLMFDAYHVGVAEGDILTKLARHMPIIGHIQIAAVPSRAEPDEGEIAYGAVFREIERLGYDGWIGCEYKPRGDTDAGLGWMKTVSA